jgi:lipopolysaccharide assembly outer membrane protein LptD (OstA)
MTPEVKVPFNINGSLLEFASRFQGDIYYLENNFQNFERDNNYKTTELNYKPEISLHWRLPLIKKTKESTIMVEPIASFVASSYDKGFNAIPLEDSNSSELTVSNLFINDRIAGHDRNEAGERINYGIKTSLFNDSGDYALTVGQAIRRSNEVQDVNISGFSENNRSNYVGRFSYSANKNFNIYYAFQLNQNNLRNDINQVNADLIMKKFSINTNYLLIKKSEFSAEKREQIAITSEVQLTPKWKTKINFVRDVVLGRNLTRGIALTRDGCCTILQFSVTENNQSNLIKAQRSFNLSISFKNL